MPYFPKQHYHENMQQISYLSTLSFLSPEKCYLPIVITSRQEFTTRREALGEDGHMEQLEDRGINVFERVCFRDTKHVCGSQTHDPLGHYFTVIIVIAIIIITHA